MAVTPIRGSCLCGAIAFEMTTEPTRVNHCHCSRCRKVRGTAHATNLVTAIDGIRYVRGEDMLTKWKLPGAKRFSHWFCRECGSSLPRFDQELNAAIVPMGSFDDDPGRKPDRHIFVDSKAPWDDITDDLPKFGGPPPSL